MLTTCSTACRTKEHADIKTIDTTHKKTQKQIHRHSVGGRCSRRVLMRAEPRSRLTGSHKKVPRKQKSVRTKKYDYISCTSNDTGSIKSVPAPSFQKKKRRKHLCIQGMQSGQLNENSKVKQFTCDTHPKGRVVGWTA